MLSGYGGNGIENDTIKSCMALTFTADPNVISWKEARGDKRELGTTEARKGSSSEPSYGYSGGSSFIMGRSNTCSSFNMAEIPAGQRERERESKRKTLWNSAAIVACCLSRCPEDVVFDVFPVFR